MFATSQHAHFIGIGGIGMSGIAEILLNLGMKVSGSDLRRGPVTDRLAALGATIYEGHNAANVAGATVVVTSSAVTAANAEVQEAQSRKIPVIQRAEMLAELMRLKYGIAIAGMHGKTTTTSMVASVLSAGGLDPTVVVGGRVDAMGSNARLGTTQYLVAEADESDRSFLKLSPILAVVTNLDREHMDCYSDMEDVERAFLDFMNRVPFYGAVTACIDNQLLKRILPRARRRVFTYGESQDADFRLQFLPPGESPAGELRFARFMVNTADGPLGPFELHVPGRHNVLNATAAIAIARQLEVSAEKIAEGLNHYRGVDRRFQRKGVVRGVTVVDDYGHHPTEIRATLAAARECGHQHIHVIFQPHRYSRTKDLMEEFGTAFKDADTVTILPIYAASEEPIAGITAENLAARISGPRVQYVPDFPAAIANVAVQASDGDLVMTLGAGSVSQLGPQILVALESVTEPTPVTPRIPLNFWPELHKQAPAIVKSGDIADLCSGVKNQSETTSRPLIWEDEAPAASRFRRVQQGVPRTGRSLPGMPLDLDDADGDDLPRTKWGRKGEGSGRWWWPANTVGRVFVGLGVAAIFGLLITAGYLTKTYLQRDGRFRIAGASSIQTGGLTEVTRAELLPVFGEDIGRNVFFVPLNVRRKELEAIPWIQHATVMRLLPDQIRVNIVERKPVAFTRHGQRIGLVDASGVLLDMAPAAMAAHHYSFPVLTGIEAGEKSDSRQMRMSVYQRMMSDLDSNGKRNSEQLSEIDLTDPEDARVLMPEQGADILAHFGEDHFLERYQRYKDHIAEWRQQYPNLAAVDLRYEHQVVLDMTTGASHTESASAKVPADLKPAALVPVALAKPKPSASNTSMNQASHEISGAQEANKIKVSEKTLAKGTVKAKSNAPKSKSAVLKSAVSKGSVSKSAALKAAASKKHATNNSAAKHKSNTPHKTSTQHKTTTSGKTPASSKTAAQGKAKPKTSTAARPMAAEGQ